MTIPSIDRRTLTLGGLGLSALLPLGLGSGCSSASDDTRLPASAHRDYGALFDFLPEDMVRSGVPGLSLAVLDGGEIVHVGAYGVINTDTGGSVIPETVFEAASLSKPLFAYFTLLQVEQDVLDLDRPLFEYWPHPDLPDDAQHRALTARMVLTHVSGLPNWRSDTEGELRFLFAPGAAYGYSGEAYEYLKIVLMHELGVDDDGLQALFDAAVTQPSGARYLRYTWDPALPSRKAYGHRDGVPTDNDQHDRTFGASYSLNTTARDYACVLRSLIHPPPEREQVVNRLLTLQSQMPAKDGELHRSLGFAVTQTPSGLRYYHSGNNGDCRAYCHLYPDTGHGVVMFANSDSLFRSDLAQRIVERLGYA